MSLSLDSNTEVPTPIMTDLQDIASMIQVNEEATVSRTVMHAEGVRLVLFSFDKDEILSEHTAAMPVILHTLEGALEGVQDDGHRSGVLAEDLVLIEAEEHQAHALSVHDGTRHRGFLVDLDHRGDVLQVRHDGRGDLGVRIEGQAHWLSLGLRATMATPHRCRSYF